MDTGDKQTHRRKARTVQHKGKMFEMLKLQSLQFCVVSPKAHSTAKKKKKEKKNGEDRTVSVKIEEVDVSAKPDSVAEVNMSWMNTNLKQ